MESQTSVADDFERQRPHLRAVAYRMLGSLAEADDAVQETWLRLSRSDYDAVENSRAWLTTIVARVALNMLRARKSRREESFTAHVPDMIVCAAEDAGADQPAMLADSVGLAMLIVLETLAPAERIAFVLHDMFAIPFEEIAPIVGRTPVAARKLASRARQRVRERAPVIERDLGRQREVVDAFFAAAHEGDFGRLLALLDPSVVLRTDGGVERQGASVAIRGASAVIARAVSFSRAGFHLRPALVNGAAGVLVFSTGRLFSIMGFTIGESGAIVEIDILADPERLPRVYTETDSAFADSNVMFTDRSPRGRVRCRTPRPTVTS